MKRDVPCHRCFLSFNDTALSLSLFVDGPLPRCPSLPVPPNRMSNWVIAGHQHLLCVCVCLCMLGGAASHHPPKEHRGKFVSLRVHTSTPEGSMSDVYVLCHVCFPQLFHPLSVPLAVPLFVPPKLVISWPVFCGCRFMDSRLFPSSFLTAFFRFFLCLSLSLSHTLPPPQRPMSVWCVRRRRQVPQ